MFTLKDFQEEAVRHLYNGLRQYNPFWRVQGGHPTKDEKTCVLQLKVITGGGKTPIMAKFLGSLPVEPGAIVLWTTPLSFVVKQTFINLLGKYNTLLSHADVYEASNLSDDIKTDIIEKNEGLDIIVATTGLWNRGDKESLKLTKATQDGGDSFWVLLKNMRRRPLIIVYDEGHNASVAQLDRLGELNPSAYLIASASPLPDQLKPWPIEPIHIPAKRIVDHGLLKTTLEIGDYRHNWETRIEIALEKLKHLEERLVNSNINPKIIYVVEDSKERPYQIMDALIRLGVSPSTIVLATKKSKTAILPRGVLYAETLEDMEGKHYKHIIFNKRLQEGWDDPEVYLAYIDQDTNSTNRITQIIGRVLRQPMGNHFDNEILNTAFFVLNCLNGNYEKIISDVQTYLEREGVVNIKVVKPKEEPIKVPAKEYKRLPSLRLTIEKRLNDIKNATKEIPIPGGMPKEWCSSEGKAVVQKVATGDGCLIGPIEEQQFGQSIRITLMDAVREALDERNPQIWPQIDTEWLSEKEWKQSFSRGSRAEKEAHERAVNRLIPIYDNCVDIEIEKFKFPIPIVGDIELRPVNKVFFNNALHEWYSALNNDEIEAANAIESTGFPWVRNQVRMSSFSIPLPSPSEDGSRHFYPDFLVWLPNGWLLALEVKGKHLLNDSLKSKLLGLPTGIKVGMVSKERGYYYRKVTGEITSSQDPNIHTSVIKLITETNSLPKLKNNIKIYP
ncbi:DEAD/DEAH box helicase [Heliophilum fasciatum]|uniref:Superfamily II DNA or RNA helicase n=1 Tax=Heliophilum fasciatum TaxID=35700 RepID=A0A4R2RTS2_9FIRM|nr:hypothetical protein [Heliophilum fasciatum]MCW2278726.1 type III restriction enzyme [Heliophilum fasciatum]TCP62535.1 superfamily II DNA or RNA helicase [Heliophilum fasciatum]